MSPVKPDPAEASEARWTGFDELAANLVERDEVLARLKGAGLNVRQIQRLTGVSLGTISNAGRK